MFSLNAPVPNEVSRLAAGLAAGCRTARTRRRHSLLVKRLGEGRHVPERAREALREAGAAPFAVRTTELGAFRDPPMGPGPVVYLAVESPELDRLHRALCERFDRANHIEGDGYVAHVTVARGGDAADLLDRSVDAREWTVDRLAVRDAERGDVATVALPA